MAEKQITIYATAPASKGDGKGGVYKVGEKVTLPKTEAEKLLATHRFTDEEDKAKAATERQKKVAK